MGTSREDIEAAIRAAGGYRELVNDGEVGSDPPTRAPITFDQGPAGVAKQIWANETQGHGVMGLISDDGTWQGAVENVLGAVADPANGGAVYKRTLRQMSEIKGPQAPVPDVDIKVQPEVPGELSGNDSQVQGVVGGQAASNFIRNHTTLGGAKGDGKTLLPESSDFLTVGGPDNFDKAYKEYPAEAGEAIRKTGELTAQKHDALAAQYGQEAERATQSMAAIQARRQADDQAIQKRVQELDQATKAYTDDLADQNKFWHSPGNIIAAISFSLMPIFSNDPAIGAKLINQAIDRDMANRKDLANMHLGELRTNLGAYRKLAEDRQAGDMLAEAEAHRVAAMQIEKLSNQFESPISKEKAKGLAAAQMVQYGDMLNQAYNRYAYNAPKLIDPRVKAGYAQGVPGAMTPLGQAQAEAQKNGAPTQGTMGYGARGILPGGGGPTTASVTGKTVALSPTVQQQIADPDQAWRMIAEKRIPGGMSAMELARSSVAIQAAYKAGGNMTPGYAPFEKAKDEIVNGAEGEIDKVREPMAKISQSVNVVTRLTNDMRTIEQSIPDPKQREAFVGGVLRSTTPDAWNSWYDNFSSKLRAEPDKAVAQRKQAFADAAMRFHQLYMMDVTGFYHDKAGANQSPSEEGRLSQVVRSDGSWSSISNYVNMRGTTLQKEKSDILNAMSPTARLLYMASEGVSNGGARLSTPGTPKAETYAGPPRAGE